MNILFINYGDFTTNSLNHIGGFANALCAQGHACVVAVPSGRETLNAVSPALFIPALHGEVVANPALFPDGRTADVVHAWTSREAVRETVVGYQRAISRPAPLIVHLEDNEEHLIAAYARRSLGEIAELGSEERDRLVLRALPHPVRHRSFLHLADRATVIVDRLREFVPATVPAQRLMPGVDPSFFAPPPPEPGARSKLGLRPEEKVIVFTGSNTFANEPEMRELYVAVRLLNDRGRPTRLVRTGFNRPEFADGLTSDLRAHVIDLGFVAKNRLPGLLALADVLVQPGRPGPFNDYRLPSKLPEFLASGRPVVLPPTNVALALRDGIEAVLLSSGTPEDIADRCARIFDDPALGARLGAAGREFARRNFDLAANARSLLALYEEVAGTAPRAAWKAIRRSQATDLTAAARLLADALEEAPPAAAGPGGADPAAVRRDLASLAADLASLDRDLEERAARERAAGETLAAAHGELQLRHGQTARHAENLAALVAAKKRQFKLFRHLTTQHIRNLEAQVEALRAADEVERLRGELKASEGRHNQTRARVNELERETREQLEAAWREHAKVAARVAEMEAELQARDRKIRTMHRSWSWRLTAPLRDLGRVWERLSSGRSGADGGSGGDPVRDESRARGGGGERGGSGGGAAEARAARIGAARPGSAASVSTEAAAWPPAESPGHHSTAVAAADGGGAGPALYRYTYNFDHPRSWSTTSNKLLILGWCYENSGAPISGLRGRFGDEIVEGVYGSKRLDVLAAHGGKRQAEYCGIKLDIRTHVGDHRLAIEVRHGNDWHPYFETVVHVGRPGDPTELNEYEKWCRQHEALEEADLAAIRTHIGRLARRPLISVAMPVYNPSRELLEKALESVRGQLYPHWELCIADDASTAPHVRPILEDYASRDPRIKVLFRTENGHICAASNSALGLATGDYVALFDHDDVLHRSALYEVAVEIDAHPDARYLYTDEDKIDGEDRRFDPYFKPDWNPDLIYGQNYTSHLSVFETALLRSLGGFRAGYEGSQDWDLLLRTLERIPETAIRHIPKVLYHWRAIPGSTALQLAEKSYPIDAARRALTDHFERRGEPVEILPVPGDHWRIKYPLPAVPPLVSLIIPTRNALNYVRRAVESILAHTDYPNYEILIVDNASDDPEALAYFKSLAEAPHSRVRVVLYPEPFNYSAINNHAVGLAAGEIVGLLNNDVEAINPGWLAEMVSQALRPRIGAVGAMLYYPINTVQHAGVILGLGGVAGHPFKEFPRGDQGDKNRLRLVQNYSAVTAACLIIRKDRFLQVGGFNAKDLPIAFNDVDLCCKLIRAGYRNLWTPYAEFYHHESATRGVEDTPEKQARFQSEVDYMTSTWGDLLSSDPAYNPNLTLVGEDFAPAYLPRTRKPWLEHVN